MFAYAICAVAVSLALVDIAKSLRFPLDGGGMAAGGALPISIRISALLLMLFCSRLAGFAGMRRSMGFGMLLMAAGMICGALAQSYFALFLCLFVSGAGQGIAEGLLTPFMNSLHPGADKGRYVNFEHGFWPLGIVFCVLGGGALLYAGVSWRFVLAGAGLTAAASSILFLWRESPENRYPESPKKINTALIVEQTVRIFRSALFYRFFFALFMAGGAEACLTYWTASYARMQFHASAWQGGLTMAFFSAGMMGGRYLCGMIARRRNLYTILIVFSLLSVPATLLISVSPSLACLYAASCASGFAIATIWPTLQVCCVSFLPKLDSTLIYVYLSCAGIPGAGLAVWGMGIAGDAVGLKGSFYLAPALQLTSVLILLTGDLTRFLRRTAFSRSARLTLRR